MTLWVGCGTRRAGRGRAPHARRVDSAGIPGVERLGRALDVQGVGWWPGRSSFAHPDANAVRVGRRSPGPPRGHREAAPLGAAIGVRRSRVSKRPRLPAQGTHHTTPTPRRHGPLPRTLRLARTTVRLHPRAGAPTLADGSIGGPLLWPADEPWPRCSEHAGPWHRGVAPEGVRLRRRILAEAWGRPRAAGKELLTDEERVIVDRAIKKTRGSQDGPVPLVSVAQLYASDVPGLPCPDGTDLLQVLWCPFDHAPDHLPRTELRWRTAAGVGNPLAATPQPSGALRPAPRTGHRVSGSPRAARGAGGADRQLGREQRGRGRGRRGSPLPVRPLRRPRQQSRRPRPVELLRPVPHVLPGGRVGRPSPADH